MNYFATHHVKFKKLMLLTTAFLSLSALSTQAMDNGQEPFSTTAGKIRQAFAKGTPLIDDSHQPPHPYRVIELMDSLSSIQDGTSVYFNFATFPPRPIDPLSVMIDCPPHFVYDTADPTKIISMTGGAPGVFSARLERLSNIKDEEQKNTIKLSNTTGYQGEGSFVATSEQIRTAFKENRSLEDPSGRRYRITSLTEQGYVPESHIVCMQSGVKFENLGQPTEKRHLTGVFKSLEALLGPIFDPHDPSKIIGYAKNGTFDVQAELIPNRMSEALASEKKDVPTTTATVSTSISTISANTPVQETIKDSNKPAPRVFKEPDHIQNKSNKIFHTFQDPKTGVHYGFELLTPENTPWWEKRLGACAHMQYKKEADWETTQQFAQTYAGSEDLFAGFISSSSAPKPAAFEITKQQLINMCPPAEYDAQYNALHEKQVPSHGGTDYLDAWKGFKYNLEKPQNCPLWVAYESSKPVEGPLYKTVSVISPDVKMEMTVLMSDTFYGALGISKDTIAQANDKEKGNPSSKQQSMPFHSAVARFVKEINPSAKFGLVRPIKSMRAVFTKSGLKFSESHGGPQNIDHPYIRYVKDVVYTWDQDKLTNEEKANFGDSPYIIVDSRTNEFHQISRDHWFSKNPFLGGMDFGTIAKYPLVTMDIESLIKYSQ